MKKFVIIMCLLLTGCLGKTTKPKDTIDTINKQKLAAAKISVQNTLALTNQKYLLESNKFTKKDDYYCISVTLLNITSEFKSGLACINSASQTKAIDIIYGSYICNGSSSSLECEKVD